MTDTLSYSDFADEVALLFLPKGATYTLEGLLAHVRGTIKDNETLRGLVEFEKDVEVVDGDKTAEHLLKDVPLA